MTPRRKPTTYDAFETDHVVGFALDAEPLASMILETRVVEGRGIETRIADGDAIRFGNVHPRIMAACSVKPVVIVALHGRSHSIAIPGGGLPDGAGDPDHAGLGSTMMWYFDQCATMGELHGRPFARFLGSIPRNVTALTMGIDVAGPPFGLCLRSESIIALPTHGDWSSDSRRLLLDTYSLEHPRSAIPIERNSPIERVVMSAFSDDIPYRMEVLMDRWRTQLAIRMG